MSASHSMSGRCHCGAIHATLTTNLEAAEIPVRACQCGFCTRHGATTVSDPAGLLRFTINRAALSGYRFDTRTGTTLLCARCGVYAGSVIEEAGKTWGILNARGLAIPEFAGRDPTPVDYEGETAQARVARRKANWTPAEIVYTS